MADEEEEYIEEEEEDEEEEEEEEEEEDEDDGEEEEGDGDEEEEEPEEEEAGEEEEGDAEDDDEDSRKVVELHQKADGRFQHVFTTKAANGKNIQIRINIGEDGTVESSVDVKGNPILRRRFGPRERKAAITIQRHFRGFLARREAASLRRKLGPASKRKINLNSGKYRVYSGREIMAIKRIQAMFRAWKVRKALRRLAGLPPITRTKSSSSSKAGTKNKNAASSASSSASSSSSAATKNKKFYSHKEHVAATRVQAVYRGHAVRNKIKKMVGAPVPTIQGQRRAKQREEQEKEREFERQRVVAEQQRKQEETQAAAEAAALKAREEAEAEEKRKLLEQQQEDLVPVKDEPEGANKDPSPAIDLPDNKTFVALEEADKDLLIDDEFTLEMVQQPAAPRSVMKKPQQQPSPQIQPSVSIPSSSNSSSFVPISQPQPSKPFVQTQPLQPQQQQQQQQQVQAQRPFIPPQQQQQQQQRSMLPPASYPYPYQHFPNQHYQPAPQASSSSPTLPFPSVGLFVPKVPSATSSTPPLIPFRPPPGIFLPPSLAPPPPPPSSQVVHTPSALLQMPKFREQSKKSVQHDDLSDDEN